MIGLGWVAMMRHEYERETHLLAASEAMRLAIGAVWEPNVRRQVDAAIERLHEEQDAAAFDQHWSEGQTMTREEVINYALHLNSAEAHSTRVLNEDRDIGLDAV